MDGQSAGVAERVRELLSDADAHARLDRYGEAITIMRGLAQEYPRDVGILMRLGFMLRHYGRLDTAQAVHATAYKLVPGSPRVHTAVMESTAALAIGQRNWPLLERVWNEWQARAGLPRVAVRHDPALPSILIRLSVDDARMTVTFGRGGADNPSDTPAIIALRLLQQMKFWKAVHAALGRAFTILLDPTDGDATLPPLPRVAASGRGPATFLIPDYEYIANHGHRTQLAELPDIPWCERRPVALWRGSTTGPRPSSGSWADLPRVRLCQIADLSEGRLDAGFNRFADLDRLTPPGDDGREMRQRLGRWLRPSVSSAEFGHARRLVAIDGHTNTWSTMMLRMATGSPVLNVASAPGWRQWYYDRLIPWRHFVPVESDMSDLLDKADWLDRHDEEARRIGTDGAAFVRSLTWDREIVAALPTIEAAERALGAL